MKADFVRDSQDHISEEALRHSAAQLIPSGAVLMVIRGMILAHSFPVAISQIALAINQDMKAMIPFRENLADILLVLLKGMTPAILRLVQRSTHGTCRLSTDELFDLPIPIPPLEEQRRMVVRVDELQALCDRLDGEQAERERLRDRVMARSFESVDGHEVDGRTALNLLRTPRFTIRREHIPKLRRLIQTLAIRGRLVAQDSDGESGAELLKRVQDAKYSS
jgi:restriction endonuclease S subunit